MELNVEEYMYAVDTVQVSLPVNTWLVSVAEDVPSGGKVLCVTKILWIYIFLFFYQKCILLLILVLSMLPMCTKLCYNQVSFKRCLRHFIYSLKTCTGETSAIWSIKRWLKSYKNVTKWKNSVVRSPFYGLIFTQHLVDLIADIHSVTMNTFPNKIKRTKEKHNKCTHYLNF